MISFLSYENIKKILTYIIFTFSKYATIKKNPPWVITRNFFALDYSINENHLFYVDIKKGGGNQDVMLIFCVDMINKRKTVGCNSLDTTIKVHHVETEHIPKLYNLLEIKIKKMKHIQNIPPIDHFEFNGVSTKQGLRNS